MQRLALAAIAATVVGMMATAVPAQAQPLYGTDNYGGGYINFGAVSSYDSGLLCIDASNCNTAEYANWAAGWEGPDTTYVDYAVGAPGRYYNRWDNGPAYGLNPGVGIASGMVGFAAGAAAANSYNDSRYVNQYADDHVARCEARYRSYDAGTNQFLGYDGQYHDCML